MSASRYFTCPFCSKHATVRDEDIVEGTKDFTIMEPVDGYTRFRWRYVVCPNHECRKILLDVQLVKIQYERLSHEWIEGETVKTWSLIPQSGARVFPSYVPQAIISDYNEACAIAHLSPKASSTLARRCLQGIIRDYWGVRAKSGRLKDEIDEIKERTDSLTWDAINVVRTVGNIGAHMEKDIDLIVDVEPDEAKLLIGLIETLLQDWYITREEKRNRLESIKKLGEAKAKDRKGG